LAGLRLQGDDLWGRRQPDLAVLSRSFLWYCLHDNPAIAARLHAELDAVLPRDQAVALEHLKRLPYATRVIQEVLRLYPPSPLMPRDVVGEQTLGGVCLPPGTTVLLFPYATHRHPDFWENPARFDPDRFLPEREAARHPFAYYPFGGGQRVCLGNSFAMLEAQIFTASIARRYQLRLVPGHRPEIEAAGTLGIRNGLPMRVARR
jgi:cytochrome P450